MRLAACLGLGLGLAAGAAMADALPESLTGMPGDARRGRAIVADRQHSLCLLCHRLPIAGERFQGEIGPDLSAVGKRLSVAEIRLRLVDPARLNPSTIMPSFHQTEGLTRVAGAFRGKPILTAAEIEDLVAFLAGLRE